MRIFTTLAVSAFFAIVALSPIRVQAQSGKVVAWGENSGGALDVPPGALSGVVSVAAGYYHSVALKNNGTVVAWGWNGFGQAFAPQGLGNVRAISAGVYHTVALKGDGTVVAWGAGRTNTGSDPEYGQSMVPIGLSGVISIAAGFYHTIALKSDGTVVAWGRGDEWSNSDPIDVPAGLNNVKAISAGGDYSVALKQDGTVVAWGYNGYNQTDVPPGLSNVMAIAAGGYYVLALKSDGTVVGWGGGGYPIRVPNGLVGVKSIAAGYSRAIALKSSGELVALSRSGGIIVDPSPHVPPAMKGVSQIAVGGYHSLAVEMVVVNISPYIETELNATITVDAAPSGEPASNYSFQWFYEGTAVPAAFGGTSPRIVLTGIPEAEGSYSVAIKGGIGETAAEFEFRVRVDSDRDGLSDGEEVIVYGSNPNVMDTDGDGLSDFTEKNVGTKMLVADSDDDGFNDGFEYYSGFDPLSKTSKPVVMLNISPSVEVRFPSAIGSVYRIEHSADLLNWKTVEDGINGTGEVIKRHFLTEDYASRYFRVVHPGN